jgi:hypothetical protein
MSGRLKKLVSLCGYAKWMFWPFRMRTIFKNRWWTLAWAALILWTAYSFASDRAETQEQSVAVEGTSEAQMAADMLNMMENVGE